MRKRVVICTLIASLLISGMSISGFAVCNHDWKEYYRDQGQYSDDQHRYTIYYECSECGERKHEYIYEDHKWVKDFSYNGKYYTAEYLSASKHALYKSYDCKVCDASKTVKVDEKHDFDKFNYCPKCDTEVKTIINLKPGKKGHLNDKSRAKIKVPGKGYITVYAYDKNGKTNDNVRWSLYNSSNKEIYDAKDRLHKMAVPVKKGTYYLKANYYLGMQDSAIIKYTFAKDPSKKNYAKNKAEPLKKNKKITTVVYPSDKKKTWYRYYKIKLTKKQRINVYVDFKSFVLGTVIWPAAWNLYDSKGKVFGTGDIYYESVGNSKIKYRYSTYRKQKPGTYYFVLERDWTILYGFKTTRKRLAGEVYDIKIK